MEYSAHRLTYNDAYKVTWDEEKQTYRVKPNSYLDPGQFYPKNEEEMEWMVNEIYRGGMIRGIYEYIKPIPESKYRLEYSEDERGQSRGFIVERPGDIVRFWIELSNDAFMTEDITSSLNGVYRRGYRCGQQNILYGLLLPLKAFIDKIKTGGHSYFEDLRKLQEEIKKLPIDDIFEALE